MSTTSSLLSIKAPLASFNNLISQTQTTDQTQFQQLTFSPKLISPQTPQIHSPLPGFFHPPTTISFTFPHPKPPPSSNNISYFLLIQNTPPFTPNPFSLPPQSPFPSPTSSPPSSTLNSKPSYPQNPLQPKDLDPQIYLWGMVPECSGVRGS